MTETTWIRAGWLIDGSGGPARRDVLAGVTDGRFASLSRDFRGETPTGCIDYSNCTMLPGLVDCHVHLFMSGTGDMTVRKGQLEMSFDEAKDVIRHHLRQQLSHGVVAVRDGGDYGAHALRYKQECLSAEGIPVQIRSAGRAWRAPGRYGRLIGRPPAQGKTLAQAIAACGEQVDHVKIVQSGINSLRVYGKETPPQFSQSDLNDAVATAEDRGLSVMVHANGRLPVEMAAMAGCLSIEHGFFMGRENLALLAERRILWVPTAFTMQGYATHIDAKTGERDIALRNLESQVEQIAEARRLGVLLGIGTDCGSLGVNHGEAFAGEVRLFLQAGFSPEETVQCATANASRLLGIGEECGRIAPDMPATFIIIPGSPAELAVNLGSPLHTFVRGQSAHKHV